MKSIAEKSYRNYINNCKETSKMFGVIPMVEGNSFFFYMFTLVVSVFIDFSFNTYFIFPLIGFIIISEYHRLTLLRKTILDMCMCDEISLESELKQNKEYLERIYEETIVLESDREDIFMDNLIYSPSRSRLNYIKNHYGFMISIMAIQFVVYLYLLTYTN